MEIIISDDMTGQIICSDMTGEGNGRVRSVQFTS